MAEMARPRGRGAGGRGTATQGAGRVIAGSARGIRLVGPGAGVRPLGDRLKEAAFGMLEPELRGRPFLDLFAGSGAGGIEALSRGASRATFVEQAAGAVAAIRRNLEATHLDPERARVVRADALDWLAGDAVAGPYAVVLVDPPYDQPSLLPAVLARIADVGRGGVLAAGGVLVAKHPARAAPPARIGLLASLRERRIGDSALTLYRWSDLEAG